MKTNSDKYLGPLLLTVVLCALAGCSKAGAADVVAPLLKVQISDVPAIQEASSIESPDVAPASLNFLDNQHVILGMNFSSAAERSAAGQYLHATVVSTATIVIFDAQTGKVTNSKSWPGFKGEASASGTPLILPIGGGDFIAGIQNTIFRFSPSFEIQAKRSLVPIDAEPRDGSNQVYWSINADAKGRSAMLMRSYQRTEQDFWISPLTLANEEELPPSTDHYIHSISTLGNLSLVSNWNQKARTESKIDSAVVEQRGKQPRALCSECEGAVLASFGKNLVLLTKRPGPSYIVTDTDGNILLRHDNQPESRAMIGNASGAADANRVAICYIDGGIPTGGSIHFAVVDVDAGKEVWNYEEKMAFNNSEKGSFHVVQFIGPKIALSPNGHTLAVLLNGVLRTYSIP